MTKEIGFSVGPVQGFVAQSRRTRDLWGSSYLLSYLSAHAMHGAATAGGQIVRPVVAEDPLYQWVASGRSGAPPWIGTVPNQFAVQTNEEPRQVATAAIEALQAAWRQVHEAVWDHYVQAIAHRGNGTEEIWRRQVDLFWELMWVAGSADQTGQLLARRKHWRTHRLPDEPGDKCTVMADFQELSGHLRVAAAGGDQKHFWAQLRAKAGELELREDERLCAPAMVKRFFARISDRSLGGTLDVDHWPSTVYLGAVPWLHDVNRSAGEAADQYLAAVRNASRDAVRRHAPLEEIGMASPAGFFRLDANYYHRAFVSSPRLAPLDETKVDRRELIALLEAVNTAAGGAPPVYYALLLADGDKLGELSAIAGREKVSRALSAFSGQVSGIVTEHSGVTVYAGGDDVLAMLPVPAALACAGDLASAYTDAFPLELRRPATLSAAVLFSHVRVPVGGALQEAHHLLDNVAKDGNGRDSLVAAVLKPGGLHCQWVSSWTRRYPDGRDADAVTQVDELREEMANDDYGRGFSASLLHHTRDTLEVLCGLRRWEPGTVGPLPADLDIRSYVQAEIVDSWDARLDDAEQPGRAMKLAVLVKDLLGTSRGRQVDGTPSTVDTTQAGVDALLLARFLASGGREEEHA